MATGDQADMLRRLKQTIPFDWFPDSSPVLDMLLSGAAWVMAQSYSLFAYAKLQTRIGTATDIFLDGASVDYLGNELPRKLNETDDQYRVRIEARILQPKITRSALVETLTDLVGQPPTIIEPWNPLDCGGYGSLTDPAGMNAGCYYDTAGNYGSLEKPFEFFVQVPQPLGSAAGVANLTGWASLTDPAGMNQPAGYGVGALAYTTSAQQAGTVSDSDIYETIESVLATNVIAWTRIGNEANDNNEGLGEVMVTDSGNVLMTDSGYVLLTG